MASQAKARLFDLYPADAAAIARIRERLALNSDALCVRIAIRNLAERLGKPEQLRDPDIKGPAQEGKRNELQK
jgi:hypothetical protein